MTLHCMDSSAACGRDNTHDANEACTNINCIVVVLDDMAGFFAASPYDKHEATEGGGLINIGARMWQKYASASRQCALH